jgi:dihydroflavonol-4-reductase
MRVFVTGAASPLGQELIRVLVQRGDEVVGQVRRARGIGILRDLGAEPHLEDLTRPRTLASAMSGCDLVFHVAQFFDFWAPQPDTFHRVNVYGTEVTMSAALAAGVRRVVVCSTALTIASRAGQAGTESARRSGRSLTSFERSKLAAEDCALRYLSRGVEVVVMHPALVVAPNDTGWMGRLVADRLAGRRRFVSNAPLGWVSVWDAVKGLVLGGDRGRNGARYVLSGETMSQRTFLSHVSRVAGRAEPVAVPGPVAFGRAALSTTLAMVSRRRPSLTVDEARFVTRGFRVDGRSASASLGFEYLPVASYLPRVVECYRSAQRGHQLA